MKTSMDTKLKQFIMLILPLLVMGMILAACDGDDDEGGGGGFSETPGSSTEMTPANDTPMVETPVTETDPPEVVETPVMTATEVTEPTAEMTPTLEVTAVITDEVTPDSTMETDEPQGAILASDLIGANVEDATGESVGAVREALASVDGTIEYVIVDRVILTDGDLGEPATPVTGTTGAAPEVDVVVLTWDDISIQVIVDEDILGDDRDFTVSLAGDAATLDSRTLEDDFLDFLDDDDYIVDDGEDDDEVNVPAEYIGLLQVSEFDDYDLQNMADDDLGNTEDLVIDMASGEILYAVTDVGGFLGIGANTIAIPWSAITIETTTDDEAEVEIFRLDVDEQFLEEAPSIDLEEWVSSITEGWDDEVEGYWATHMNS